MKKVGTMRRHRWRFGPAALLLAGTVAGCAIERSEASAPVDGDGRVRTTEGIGASPSAVWPEAERIRGLALSASRDEVTEEALRPLASVGANWVAVIPYAFLSPDDPNVVFDRERQFWGERTEGVAATIEHARANGLKVLLKPHLWVRGQGWPGEFVPGSEAHWTTFLEGYADYVLRFARIADSLDVDMLSIGTEVDRVAIERPDFWRDLISRVREVYGGPLTYAANWDRYQDVAFWDALDLIGVDAYFPLVADATPQVDDLVAAWEPWATRLAKVSARTGKPVLFAEFGYRSMDGAAGEQWELPDGRAARGIPPNAVAQAAAYEALFRVWWDRPWFAGGFAWKWYPGDPSPEWAATDYTPQGKLAESVIATWYGGDARSGGMRPPPLDGLIRLEVP